MKSKELKPCEQRSGDLEPGAYTVTNSISHDTTVEQFKQVLALHPDYKLSFGGRCGWNALGSAAFRYNLDIVKWILDQDASLINLGSGFGLTPLHCLIRFCEPKTGTEICEYLVSRGADVNMCTSSCFDDTNYGPTYDNTSPLWSALNRRNVGIVQLLLKHEALVSPSIDHNKDPRNHELRKFYKYNLDLYTNRKLYLAGTLGKKNSDGVLYKLPMDLKKYIYKFVCSM